MANLQPNEVKDLAALLRAAGVEGARALTRTYTGEPCIVVPGKRDLTFSQVSQERKSANWKEQRALVKLVDAVVATFLAKRPGFIIKIRWS